MKKERGFTLVELLATIVILGLLALIVTPGIAKVIRSSKMNTAKVSLEGYVRELENAVALYMTDTGEYPTSVDQLEIDGKNISKIVNPNVVFNSDGTISKITAIVNEYKCAYIENDGVTCYEEDVVAELTFDESKCSTTLTSISDIDTMNGKLNTCVTSPIGEVTYTGSIGKKTGEYVINYSVEDEFGNKDTLSKTFTVNITLSIVFDDSKCETTLTSSDAITEMNSNLNSCINASGEVSHTGTIGSTNGTYDIVYTVTDAYENTNTLTKTFTVEFPPPASVSYDNIGDYVYYDPVNNITCTTYEESNSASGTIEGCMKWHVLSENADGTVNLILDHNILSGIEWYSSIDNPQGPTVAVEALNNAINDTWSTSLVRSDSYSHTYNNGTESKTYTVNYSGMKARLPEAQEIANAVGYTTWNEDTATVSNYFYFDSKSTIITVGYGEDKTTSDYDWLFNNLNNRSNSTDASNSSTCLYYGCTQNLGKTSGDYGYWTSTAVAGRSGDAWNVTYFGDLRNNGVSSTGIGVRPVITLSN